MVRKLYNQNYQKLKRDLQGRGELFTDPMFPPDASSLFYSGRNDLDIVWKRPGELFSDPRLVVNGLAPSDLNQGHLGNCWFVAACSALALEERLWNKVVVNVNEQEWNPTHPEHYAGIFHFHFWQFGEWVDVVVDDWLPTRGGELVYMKSKDGNEFWSALLEKAYAKLAGSYEALTGGQTADALVDFTGGVGEVIRLHSHGLEEPEDQKNLFDNLLEAHEHQAMISCSISLREGDPPEGILSCGLVQGHAYTVTDIRRMKLTSGLSALFSNKEKLLMIKMRNPWGKTEWKGPWSDNSGEWKKVPKSEQDKMNLKVEDDGEFWMEFSDWLEWFTDCSVCRIVNTSVLSLRKTWHDASFHGKWQGRSAGGSVNQDTFLNNPQYSFTLREEEEVMVSLMQKDPRTSKSLRAGGKEPAANFSVGFMIMKIEENRRYRIHTVRKEVGSITFINRRSVFGRFKFPQGRYCIVPSTFEPNQEREFMLRFFSERNARALELKEDMPTRGFCGYLCCCCIKPYRGMVSVEIHGAHDLAKQDTRGAGADPYCKVTCGSETVVTPVRASTLDPNFDSHVVFYVKNPEDATVKIQVMNHGLIRDRFMGQASATLPAADGGRERRTLKLMEKGNRNELETQGSVTFTVNHYADLRAT